nr:uncharacterized protein LOC104100013 [Nicotiana tomentosiformis]
MAEEHPLVVQEVAMPSIANVTSSIVKPRIKARIWLKSKPANSIASRNDLACKFLARFFPSSKTAKIRSEIVAFKQREGLHPETKIVVDATASGQVLEKNVDEIYVLLNKFSKSNPDWHGEAGRHTAHRVIGVLELDVVSALSAQVQPVEQVQVFCEVCGEGHTSDACPANPESVYFVDNANRGQANHNQYGNTYNPNWRNHPNFSRVEIRNTRPAGALPIDTEANPKDPINAVSLRNGRELEEVPSKKRKQVTFSEKQSTREVESETAKESEKPIEEINIPLVDNLQEVSKYEKYIKEIVANKRKLTEFEIVALTEE